MIDLQLKENTDTFTRAKQKCKQGEKGRPSLFTMSEIRKRNLRHLYDLAQSEAERKKQVQKRMLKMGKDSGNLEYIPIHDYIDASSMFSDTILSHRKYRGKATFLQMRVSHPFRKMCIFIVEQVWFSRFILFCILANSVFVALDNPLHSDREHLQFVLYTADIIFSTIYTVEMIIKVSALGFINNGGFSYIRDPWNVLDFIVVVLAVPVLLGSAENLASVKLIRILRPLRTINGIEGVRLLVTALVQALPLMRDIFLLFGFVILLFGIAGMQMFGGKFRQQCYFDDTGLINSDRDNLCPLVVGNTWSCDAGQSCLSQAENPNEGVTGFDNIFQSWLTVLQCISLEGWSDVMYYTFETLSYATFIYFVLLVVFGAYFLINLVNAVLCSIYQKEQDALLIDEQLELEKELQRKGPHLLSQYNITNPPEDVKDPPPTIGMRVYSSVSYIYTSLTDPLLNRISPEQRRNISARCLYLAESIRFQVGIYFIIILNTILLASEHYGQPQWWTDTLEYANYAFTAKYTMEIAIKVTAYSWEGFWKDGFNTFDLLVVVVSYGEIILAQVAGIGGVGLKAFRTLRLLRVLRVLKLSNHWSSLQGLVINYCTLV